MAFHINLDESFPYLSKAPIVEAVLQISARALTPWAEEAILPKIREAFPENTQVISEQGTEQHISLKPGVGLGDFKHSLFWQGVLIPKGERPEIIRFARDFFLFSRLAPYEGWEPFLKRASELLGIYMRVAAPHTAQRIGLRFINRIEMLAGPQIEDYFSNFPRDTSGLDLPISGFLHQETFAVPALPYAINLTRAAQPALDVIQAPALILDLDVHTTKEDDMRVPSIEGHLMRMRWLKNKVFFSNITASLLERLK
jgi:uncharacterized protein (TIGR04255 family)